LIALEVLVVEGGALPVPLGTPLKFNGKSVAPLGSGPGRADADAPTPTRPF
jgi:hypothetical protein